MAQEGRLFNSRFSFSSGFSGDDFGDSSQPEASLGGGFHGLMYQYDDSDIPTSGFTDEQDGAQTDPLELTLSADGASRNTDALVGAWVQFSEGVLADLEFTTKVKSHVGSAYRLEDPCPALQPGGDRCVVYKKHGLFPAVTAAQCASGVDQYRCVAIGNETGILLTDVRAYWRLSDPGDVEWAVACSDVGTGHFENRIIADEFTTPYLSEVNPLRFAQVADAFFGTPLAYEQGIDQPKTEAIPVYDLVSGGGNVMWMWIRRRVLPDARAKSGCWAQLVIEVSNTGLDPDPMRAVLPIGYDLAGIDQQIAVAKDGDARIGGGVPIRITKTSVQSGLPLPGNPIARVKTGDPGSIGGLVDPQFDDDGEATVLYIASADPADEGLMPDIEVHD